MKKIHPKKWWNIDRTLPDETTIYIYDEITEFGSDPQNLIDDINNIDTPYINIRINSPGGYVFDGVAIYNAIKSHPAQVSVYIDALAASIASVIAMAGDKIEMAENSFLMIHNAWLLTVGNKEELRREADLLEKLDESIANIYASRTGMEIGKIMEMMGAETWIGADEAIEMGFIDSIGENKKIAALTTIKYKNMPEGLVVKEEEPTLRDAEKALRDAGFSRKHAKAIVSGKVKDEDGELEAAKQLLTIIGGNHA